MCNNLITRTMFKIKSNSNPNLSTKRITIR